MQMTLGLGMKLGQTMAGSLPLKISPVTEILADGWRAEHRDIPSFSTTSEARNVAVNRRGFDTAATAVSRASVVQLTSRVRQPYPDHSNFTDKTVACSDFVYAGDTINGAINHSTRPAPRPIAMWLNHDRERVEDDAHILRLAVAHAYAQQGQPVAAVRFIVRDTLGNEASQLVSSQSSLGFDASGLHVPHYAATVDLSGLAQGDLLTVDATIYPWVGDAFSISADADEYPSPNLTTLRMLNDTSGGYGACYAQVDGTTGDDATGQAASARADAIAAPFASIAAAANAIKEFNAAHFGRVDDAGGGTILLAEGAHILTPFKAAGHSAQLPLCIRAEDPSKRDSTILTDGGVNRFNGIPTHLKICDVTLQKGGANTVFLDSGAESADNLLITKNCLWDANGFGSYGAWVYRVGRFVQINCSVVPNEDPHQGNSFSNEAIMVTAIGCKGCAGTITYQALGCSGLDEFTLRAPIGNRPAMTGTFLGWNTFSNGSATNAIVSVSAEIGARGFAFVGNIVESWGSSTNAALRLNADSDTNAAQNIVVHNNTIAGERANLLYLDGTENVAKSGSFRNNLFHRINIKSDVFSGETYLTGNWTARYKVGWSHNVAIAGSSNEPGYGPSSWLGELPSIGEVSHTASPWVDDRSHTGSNTGSGDYRPDALSDLPKISPAQAPYGSDLVGNTLGDSGFIGAVLSSA